MRRFIAEFGQVVATPHVLAEVSNLADLKGRELLAAREALKALVEHIDESFDPSAVLVKTPLFMRLGLTDAAIGKVSEAGTLVLTADLELHLALQQQGMDSINFNHLRAISPAR